jgi:predicted RNA-binding protein with PIN domain
MKEYVIDGNNLIHKIGNLATLQKKDPQSSREKLALRLEGYFASKKVKVYLYFDGHENLPIRTGKVKVLYSGSRIADEGIRKHIERASNPRNIVLVSSDDEIKRLAHACSAEVIKSEEFAKLILSKNEEDEEEKRIRGLDDDEFKKLFGVDE